MKFIVGHVRDEGAINVGRPTPLGNPFVMHGEHTRDAVCDNYEAWFNDKVARNDERVMNQLRSIWKAGRGKEYVVLGCWCAPRRCHAETIARYLNQFLWRKP